MQLIYVPCNISVMKNKIHSSNTLSFLSSLSSYHMFTKVLRLDPQQSKGLFLFHYLRLHVYHFILLHSHHTRCRVFLASAGESSRQSGSTHGTHTRRRLIHPRHGAGATTRASTAIAQLHSFQSTLYGGLFMNESTREHGDRRASEPTNDTSVCLCM